MKQTGAIVLAGGKGTRLQPMTITRPKPLIPVGNYPMINYSLWCLKQAGIEDVVLVVKYLGDQIRKYIGDGNDYGLNIVIPDFNPLDTADAVRKSANFIQTDDFIVTMADLVTNVDLRALIEFHRAKGGFSSIALKSVPDPLQFGVIMLDETQKIILFLEKPIPQELYVTSLTFAHRKPVYLHLNLINAGIYAFKTELLNILDADTNLMDFGAHVFPYLLREQRDIYGYVLPNNSYWMDCGTPQKVLWANWDATRRYTWPYLPRGEENNNSWWGNNITLPKSVRIDPPVVIGHNCVFGEGSVISNRSTINDNCTIGKYSKINSSILWESVNVGDECSLYSCIICSDVTIGNNIIIGENVIIGEGSLIKDRVEIHPNTRIAPYSIIE